MLIICLISYGQYFKYSHLRSNDYKKVMIKNNHSQFNCLLTFLMTNFQLIVFKKSIVIAFKENGFIVLATSKGVLVVFHSLQNVNFLCFLQHK